ncbi:hypothetical protein [Catenuloplanes atrovinosus]|uniref:Lipoprotein n=1 Tax=Catenuloplanes atrovinosus TaxID=137266 RepID=A0AAE3YY77_9ACTN|nr:hypothetical protein [Catenuloplanes atrovinosus]MDR7280801.1 hypothetical protein [Catenuloplanes atrovinosus]
MKTTRGFHAGIAGLAAVAVALGGCGAQGSAAPAPASASATAQAVPADPKAALAASVNAINVDTHYAFAVDSASMKTSGVVHGPTRSMALTSTMTGEPAFSMELYYVEPHSTYMRTDVFAVLAEAFGAGTAELTPLGLDGEKWLRFDPARARDFTAISFADTDLADVAEPLGKGLVSAEQTGPGQYKGVANLYDHTPSEYVMFRDEDGLDEKLKAVPFTAALDAQGRLTSVAYDIGGAPLTITFSEYGSAAAPAKPAGADVVEATDATYSQLDSQS